MFYFSDRHFSPSVTQHGTERQRHIFIPVSAAAFFRGEAERTQKRKSFCERGARRTVRGTRMNMSNRASTDTGMTEAEMISESEEKTVEQKRIFLRNAPKSQYIADLLREEILSGKLRKGERLESVRSLSAKFGVGRQVILSAFQRLSREKLLDGKVGSGTFVSLDPERKFSGAPAPKNREHTQRFAYVIIGDDTDNKFYGALFKGFTKYADPASETVLLYEHACDQDISRIAEECDALAVTGSWNNKTLEALLRCGKKYVTVGNRFFSGGSNNFHFSVEKSLRDILEADKSHSKSVGLILGAIFLPITRTLIDEAERYSTRYNLLWDENSVVCANSVYGVPEIERAWGENHAWPQRLVTTLHTYLGLAQFFMENGIPESRCPEITVMVSDKSFLPLPYQQKFNPVACHTNDADSSLYILDLLRRLLSGELQEGFLAEYDPVLEKVSLRGRDPPHHLPNMSLQRGNFKST